MRSPISGNAAFIAVVLLASAITCGVGTSSAFDQYGYDDYPSIPGQNLRGLSPEFNAAMRTFFMLGTYFPGLPKCNGDNSPENLRCWQRQSYLGKCAAVQEAAERALDRLGRYKAARDPSWRAFEWSSYIDALEDMTRHIFEILSVKEEVLSRARIDHRPAPEWIETCRKQLDPLMARIEAVPSHR